MFIYLKLKYANTAALVYYAVIMYSHIKLNIDKDLYASTIINKARKPYSDK